MAGLYEIWRDQSLADDDPDRFRWTCTVLTTDAEDSLGHIHDRMPLMVERDRWADWLDPRVGGELSLLVPAAPGQPRGLPRLAAGQQRPQQRPGARRAAPARGRPLMITAVIRSITTPYGEAGCTSARAVSPSRPCCSATVPAAASTPPT